MVYFSKTRTLRRFQAESQFVATHHYIISFSTFHYPLPILLTSPIQYTTQAQTLTGCEFDYQGCLKQAVLSQDSAYGVAPVVSIPLAPNQSAGLISLHLIFKARFIQQFSKQGFTSIH